MFCQNCGNEIKNGTDNCQHCAETLKESNKLNQNSNKFELDVIIDKAILKIKNLSKIQIIITIIVITLIITMILKSLFSSPNIIISVVPDNTSITFIVKNNTDKYMNNVTIKYRGMDNNGSWYYSGKVSLTGINPHEVKTVNDIFWVTKVPQRIGISQCYVLNPNQYSLDDETEVSFKMLESN